MFEKQRESKSASSASGRQDRNAPTMSRSGDSPQSGPGGRRKRVVLGVYYFDEDYVEPQTEAEPGTDESLDGDSGGKTKKRR